MDSITFSGWTSDDDADDGDVDGDVASKNLGIVGLEVVDILLLIIIFNGESIDDCNDDEQEMVNEMVMKMVIKLLASIFNF